MAFDVKRVSKFILFGEISKDDLILIFYKLNVGEISQFENIVLI